jgi:hypothetical protein
MTSPSRSTSRRLEPRARGLGRASCFGTVTTVGDRLVIVGGYDDRIRAASAVWLVSAHADQH